MCMERGGGRWKGKGKGVRREGGKNLTVSPTSPIHHKYPHPTGGYYYITCNNLLATHMISIMEPGLSCLGVTVHAAS